MADLNTQKNITDTVLIVDDEELVLKACGRVLKGAGFTVATAATVPAALAFLAENACGCVVSDVHMPDMGGLRLLSELDARGLVVPVVLCTGSPDVHSAMKAVQHGVFQYLQKPVMPEDLVDVVRDAVRRHQFDKRVQATLCRSGGPVNPLSHGELEQAFDRALERLWMAYQPILSSDGTSIVAYEALLRSSESSMSNPLAIIRAAEYLGRVHDLGFHVRYRVREDIRDNNVSKRVFVNLHPFDLTDPMLFSAADPLWDVADQIVLEITERANLIDVDNIARSIDVLRQRGFTIAIDDLGAGYASLSSFAILRPSVLKIDMSLIRDIDIDQVKQQVTGALLAMARSLDVEVVAEGIETAEERDTMTGLGADMLQGYLFARPAREFITAAQG